MRVENGDAGKLTASGSTLQAPCVHILYGTETGTAEEVSLDLRQYLQSHNVNVLSTCAMDTYSISNLVRDSLKQHCFVFVAATTGDGVAPSSMSQFWRKLRLKSLKAGVLNSCRVAVFGLGDRAYGDAFNACARRLFARLKKLGATSLVELGLGDEGHPNGYEAALSPWMGKLVDALLPERMKGASTNESPAFEPLFSVETVEGESSVEDEHIGRWDDNQGECAIDESYYCAKVKGNTILTNQKELDSPREVRHIVLDVSNAAASSLLLNFVPGDVAHIIPRNDPSTVSTFLQLTNLASNLVVRLNPSSTTALTLNLTGQTSITNFVAANLDLTSVPRKRFLQQLARFTTSSIERTKLEYLASADGFAERYQYLVQEQRSVLGVLRDFPNARPQPEILLSIIPRLRPRSFSIASSSRMHSGEIHICAAMMQKKVVVGRRIKMKEGVCSRFWQRCRVGDMVPVRIGKGSLQFIKDKPAVLIGPGTGIAPIRAFLQDVKAGFQSNKQKTNRHSRILFFGCRRAKGDYLYKDEWASYCRDGVLTGLFAAFSREIDQPKDYVQNKMQQNSKLIYETLQKGGRVYIAGSAGAMPRGVKNSLTKTIEEERHCTVEEARAHIEELQRSRRLQVECW